MTFTIHDLKIVFNEDRTKKIAHMLYSNLSKLEFKRKIVYTPIVTRHGTAAEMRQEVLVYEIDNVIELYEYKISPVAESKGFLLPKYKRMLGDLYKLEEYLNDRQRAS